MTSRPRLSLFVPVLLLALLLGAKPLPPPRSFGTVAAGAPQMAGVGPTTFFEVRGEPELLARRLAELPVKIRFAGLGWALIEVRDSDLAAVVGRLPASRVLRRAESPLRLFALAESELTDPGRAECEPFTLLRSTAEDLRVLALPAAPGSEREAIAVWAGGKAIPAAEHIGGAHALPLPESMSPRALAPLPAAERANPYRQSRLGDPAARARAVELAGQVDSARIMRIVRELSTGPGATRYSCRDEVNTFAGEYLLDTLQSIFSAQGDQVFTHPFTIQPPHCDPAAHLFNVIARRPGQRPGSGRYILSAHYDATGVRTLPTGEWNGDTDPAPGADDNLSGVACVIEAARILLQASYDFDLEVALFSGEELGLIGSHAYAADTVAAVEEVLGVINLDMVGYSPRAADSLNAITNLTSEWLADLVVEAEQVLSGDHGLMWFDKVVALGFGRSDHAAFWNHGQSAILLIENLAIEQHNPNYHRTSDTFEALAAVEGGDLMRRTAETVVATIGQFAISAIPEASFSIPDAGVLFYRSDGRFLVDAAVGQAVNARARVFNAGAAVEGSVDVHGILSLGGGRVVATVDTSFAGWGSGVWREVVLPWVAPNQVGLQAVRADLTLSEGGSPLASVAGSASFEVVVLLREAVIAPNPIRGSLAAGELRLVQLAGDADLRCQVFDALGNEVGRFTGRVVRGQRISLQEMIDGADLPSGVYVLLFDLRPPGQDATVASEKLTFAYMR